MWTIFKVFIESVTILFLCFGPKACGVLASDQELNPHHLHWKVNS